MGKKYVLFTDIHFGEHGNSDEFNQDCIDFIEFMVRYYQQKVPTEQQGGAIFLGDWYHSRNQVNVKTMDYAVKGLSILDKNLPMTKMLLGNHDLFYHDRRDITSVHLPNGATNIEVIDTPRRIELDGQDCIFCPWLINDETLTNVLNGFITAPDYVFGHFELPTFFVNKMTQMKGDFDLSDVKASKRVFTGHYHMRQERADVCYIGNCFSHNFSDANDWKNKGFAIVDLQENKIDEFVEWVDAPKYLSANITKLRDVQTHLDKTVHLRLVNDAGLLPTDLNTLIGKVQDAFGITDISVVSPKLVQSNESTEKLEHIDDINVLVTKTISSMQFENLSTDKLVEIYNSL